MQGLGLNEKDEVQDYMPWSYHLIGSQLTTLLAYALTIFVTNTRLLIVRKSKFESTRIHKAASSDALHQYIPMYTTKNVDYVVKEKNGQLI